MNYVLDGCNTLLDIMSLKFFIGLSRSQGQLINALMAPITDVPSSNFVTQCSILEWCSTFLASWPQFMEPGFANGEAGVPYLHRTRLTNLSLCCPNMAKICPNMADLNYFHHPHVPVSHE